MPRTRKADVELCSLTTSQDVKTERQSWAGGRKTVYIRDTPTTRMALRVADQNEMTLDDTIGLVWLYKKLEEVRAFATSMDEYPQWLDKARPVLNKLFDPAQIRWDTTGPQRSVAEVYKCMAQLMPMLYVALLKSDVARSIHRGEYRIEV